MSALFNPRAVFFDMGGTLERMIQNDELRLAACRRILAFLAQAGVPLDLDPPALLADVMSGARAYLRGTAVGWRELAPADVWRDYLLRRHVCRDARLGALLGGLGEELAFIWDMTAYQRELRPETPGVLAELRARGYQTGIISNTFSVRQVGHDLSRFGLEGSLDVVVLSSACGYRKPGPRIFELAAGLLGLAPGECVYVGDTPASDMAGARGAGFAAAILLDAPGAEKPVSDRDRSETDAVISSLAELPALLA